MSAFDPVEAPSPSPSANPPAPAEPRLWVGETLASSRRVWLRGRLLAVPPAPSTNGNWYKRWWGKAQPPEPPRSGRLETRVSGTVLEADVPISPDGRFEALLPAELPPARRGWRVARNRLTYAGKTFEACALLLTPTPAASRAIVVVLPIASTFSRDPEARALAGCVRLNGWPASAAGQPIYYLAAVPLEAEDQQRELALATTALGWPAGHFVLLPAERASAASSLAVGVARLRWLFAGSLDVEVFNLEPEAASLLATDMAITEDRARVVRLANLESESWRMAVRSIQDSVVQESLRPLRARRVTRFPLVFCHGMLAFSTIRMQLPENLNSFASLGQSLRDRGFRTLFPQVAPTSGIVDRARQLCEQIQRWTDQPVNLIAHSMGGLDARYLISHLNMADHVKSLTTISTPHRGTFMADWFIANYRNRVPLLLAMQAMGVNVDGFRDCKPSACTAFNAATPDMPGVTYFSYGGAVSQSRVTPFLRRAWTLLTPVEGANDGMVSVASARWGEYLGTIAADHFAQTPDAAFIRPGEDFDAAGFCFGVVEELARRGF
jgi:triacylglycerol lipase